MHLSNNNHLVLADNPNIVDLLRHTLQHTDNDLFDDLPDLKYSVILGTDNGDHVVTFTMPSEYPANCPIVSCRFGRIIFGLNIKGLT